MKATKDMLTVFPWMPLCDSTLHCIVSMFFIFLWLFFFSGASQYFIGPFGLLLDEDVVHSPRTNKYEVSVFSDCFVTYQTCLLTSERLMGSRLPAVSLGGSQLIKHRRSYEGSAPIRPVTACALTHVWTPEPTQSGRRDEDVHQVRAVEVVHISPLEIILTRA